MKQTGRLLLCLLIFSSALISSVNSLELKLGTTAPPGSPWDFALKELASQWYSLSKGRVSIKIYSGGIAGTEDDMIRKTRIGQLQAVVVTGSGLASISPELLALSLPLLVRTDSELDYLLIHMEDDFNALLEEKGFSVIAWKRAGWLKVFSKREALTPAELRLHRLALPLEDLSFQQIWRSMGFNIISLQSNDFLTGLQAGMVDAIISAPLVAAAYQWFPLVPHMNEISFAPLVGALVVDTKTWRRVPEDLRELLLLKAREVLSPLEKEISGLESEAVVFMKGMNLIVSPVPPEVLEEWSLLCSRGYSTIIGNTISKELFNRMEKTLEDYRSKPQG